LFLSLLSITILRKRHMVLRYEKYYEENKITLSLILIYVIEISNFELY